MQAIFGKGQTVGAEGTGFHHLTAHGHKAAVNLTDHIGAGDYKVIVAAVERLAAKVLGSEVVTLDVCPHRPIIDENVILDSV